MKMDSRSAKDKFEVNRQASFFHRLAHNLNWVWQMTSAISTDTSKQTSGPSGRVQSLHSEPKWDSLPSAVLDACLRAFSALTSVTSASCALRIPSYRLVLGLVAVGMFCVWFCYATRTYASSHPFAVSRPCSNSCCFCTGSSQEFASGC